jgi:hypothetical protein
MIEDDRDEDQDAYRMPVDMVAQKAEVVIEMLAAR